MLTLGRICDHFLLSLTQFLGCRFQLGSFLSKRSYAAFAEQSNLTWININHSSSTRLFTRTVARPTLHQPRVPPWKPTLPDPRQWPITTFCQKFFIFKLFTRAMTSKTRPNWFYIADSFLSFDFHMSYYMLRSFLRVSNTFWLFNYFPLTFLYGNIKCPSWHA